MVYAKHTGTDAFVSLPASGSGEFYTEIGPKAFLSHKEILELTLPSSIERIGDWAFAHMHNLKKLVLPAADIIFGKKVFLDCSRLEQLQICPDTSGNPGLPYFLASLVTVFPDKVQAELLKPLEAGRGETNPQWMQQYDKVLTDYLSEEDHAGFEPVFYGWFNDEDADSSQRPQYIQKQREYKVYLTFLRLRYDFHLCEENRQILYQYLRDHMPSSVHSAAIQASGISASDGQTPGSKNSDKPGLSSLPEHTAVWDLLPTHYAEDVCYYEILADAKALSPDSVPAFIAHLPQASPEVIAYLLRYQSFYRNSSDFFDNFSL